ncbi:hypothetical protein [Pseudomonas sp. LRF_L74]|uniref:hypothetical protein n=1 Tax=Pseudomonas sp. LRF_L74 TaxID=3369422 RepID=UPI003F63BCD4
MIDYQSEHRCLLQEVASGQHVHTRPARTIRALLLTGFLTVQKTTDENGKVHSELQLTPVGHRYLAGLWH